MAAETLSIDEARGLFQGPESGVYLSEVSVIEGSVVVDKTLRAVEQLLDDTDAQIIAMVRNGVRLTAPNPRRILRKDDILVIEVEPESLSSVLTILGLKLEEQSDVPADLSEDTPNESAEEDEKNTGLT